jgi:hypothetical protein
MTGERAINKGKLAQVFSYGNGHGDMDKYAISLSARATSLNVSGSVVM